uniref:Uncharacterized protein n=1 Tax=Panagrolaimus superbus TaxID=310955 RepID=A0A914Y363_9BILA
MIGEVTTRMPMRFNRLIKETTKSSTLNDSKIRLDFCKLPEVDPWDPAIMEYIKPEKDHMLNCERTLFEHSKLVDGQLFMYTNDTFDESILCHYRCIFPDGDHHLNYGNWTKVINETKPECDVIEVECRGKNEVEVFYQYLHAQIYRNTTK